MSIKIKTFLSIGAVFILLAALTYASNNIIAQEGNLDVDDNLTVGGIMGIGTTEPNQKLHVSGSGTTSARIESIGGGDAQLYLTTDSANWIFDVDGNGNGGGGEDDLYIKGGTIKYITLQNNTGYVGIGTTNPDTLLHVNGATDASLSDGSGVLLIGEKDSTNIIVDNNEIIARNNAANSLLYIQNEGGNTTFGGNVGIGTTTPTYPLTVRSGTSKGIRLDNTNGNPKVIMYLDGNDNGRIYLYNDGDSNTILLDSDGDSFFNNGDVGIGTTNPDSDLTIGSGSTSGNKNIHIEDHDDAYIFLEADEDNSGEDDNAYIKFSQDNAIIQAIMGTVGNAGYDPENVAYTGAISNAFLLGTNTPYPLQLGTNDNVRMTIESGGDVGIATTSPDHPLDVYGAIHTDSWSYADSFDADSDVIVGNIAGLGTVDVYASNSGYLYGSVSDSRLKKNSAEIDNALDKVMQLNGIYFNWDESNDFVGRIGLGEQREIGIIAEEAELVIPEITGRNKDGYITLSYSKLTPLLVEAVKELKHENDGLKQENDLIKSELCKKDSSYGFC